MVEQRLAQFGVVVEQQRGRGVGYVHGSYRAVAGILFREQHQVAVGGLHELVGGDGLPIGQRKAAEMIRSGDFLIKEIYEQVGFKTSSYFSACFREEFGMTPKQYKDQNSKPKE